MVCSIPQGNQNKMQNKCIAKSNDYTILKTVCFANILTFRVFACFSQRNVRDIYLSPNDRATADRLEDIQTSKYTQLHIHYTLGQLVLVSVTMSCLQCFDTVGWVVGRASGL